METLDFRADNFYSWGVFQMGLLRTITLFGLIFALVFSNVNAQTVIQVPTDTVTVTNNSLINKSKIGTRDTFFDKEKGDQHTLSGGLIQTGRTVTNDKGAYISQAEISGGSFTNNGQVDYMEISGRSTYVTNNGNIGIFTTGTNWERFGGVKMTSGYLINNSYIAKLDISGGEVYSLQTGSYIRDITMTGGTVKINDESYTLNISGGEFVVGYSGTIRDSLVMNGGYVRNENNVNHLVMNDGKFEHLLNDKSIADPNRTMATAVLGGGEFIGDSRVADMILQGYMNLNTADYTGDIGKLTMEDSSILSFFVASFDDFSKLNIGVEISSLTNVQVNFADTFDWEEGFDLSRLFNFSEAADSSFEFDWDIFDLSLDSALYDISGSGVVYRIDSVNGGVHTSDIGLLNGQTPEPATLAILGIASLVSIPLYRSRRRA